MSAPTTPFEQVLKTVAPNSQTIYRYAWKRWMQHEKRAPAQWSMASVEAARAGLSSSYKPATVRFTFTVAKRVWTQAQLMGLVPEEAPYPFRRLKISGGGSNVPEWNVLQPGELGKLEQAMVDAPRDIAIVRTLTMQGWRESILCKLKWEDLNREADGTVVAAYVAKGHKPTFAQVMPKVMEAVERWQGKRPRKGPFVARSPAGDALRPVDIYKVVTKWSKRVLGHKVTPHGLRATFISAAIEQVGLDEARKLAGHTDIKMTQRYSRWGVKRLKTELKF